MARILVADDEPDLREALKRVFEADGHEVLLARDGPQTVELARTSGPDLLVLDNRMPGMSGLDALAEIRRFDPSLVTVLFTAYDDAADVQRAILDLEAFGYLTKDSGVEAIRGTIYNALRSRGMATRPGPGPPGPAGQPGGFADMVGESAPILHHLIRKIAHSDVTVLVQGESGTGKELVARAIHETSRRAGNAYVPVDCGTLPETLTESEIFGHEAGAFTDAKRAKPGKLELADEGTLFLDEIGNLPPAAQAKLLRVLEDRRVTRLGGQDVKTVDVRVIAATNLDLERASREGTFREDLYYRLNVFSIALPPLRERREDVLPIARHFLHRFREEQGKHDLVGLSSDAADVLRGHAWPGNVRELRNVMERAVLLSDEEIRPEHLPESVTGRGATGPEQAPAAPVAAPGADARAGETIVLPLDLDGVPLKEAKHRAGERVERAYLLAALRRSGWNKAEAARILELNYKTLREKVREHGLERPRSNPEPDEPAPESEA